MDLVLQNLNAVKRSIGKGIVFYAPKWTPELGEPLALTHLGDTEGDISVTLNGEVSVLTLPEISGPAAHEADYTGENPVIEMPLFLASMAMLAVISPAGSAHAGNTLRRPATEYTLAIIPEALFIAEVDGQLARRTLAYAGGSWTLNGEALTADQLALLATSMWFWRGFFNRPTRRFLGGSGDARKQIETSSFQVMHHPEMPEGHQLYTTGDPNDAGIDLEGAS